MARRAKQPESDSGLTIHTTFRVPRDLHDRLTAAAAKAEGRGIGEEIRRRLEESFMSEITGPDVETTALAAAIHRMAREIRFAYGTWHKDPFAFEVFKASINTLLGYFCPKGEPKPRPSDPEDRVAIYYGLDATPETIGRIVAAGATVGRIAGMLGLPSSEELPT